MRVVIQRTAHASVTINGHCKAAIGQGMMILVGIEEADGQEDIDWLCKKIVNLRIFDDENGVMNRSILDPPVVYTRRQAGDFNPPLRTVLPGPVGRTGQGNRHGRIRCRHESGAVE